MRGVGIVNALEIVNAFPMRDDPIAGLTNFAGWLNSFDIRDIVGKKAQMEDNENESIRRVVRSFHSVVRSRDVFQQIFNEKHKSERKRWSVPSSFPDPSIAKVNLFAVIIGGTLISFMSGIP